MKRTAEQESYCASRSHCPHQEQTEPKENKGGAENITGQHCFGTGCEYLSWHNIYIVAHK
jgi:hypothetical protein